MRIAWREGKSNDRQTQNHQSPWALRRRLLRGYSKGFTCNPWSIGLEVKVWLKPICNPQYWAYLVDKGLVHENEIEFTGCTAGITRFHIFPNGDVTPCAYLPVKTGNIREQRFLDIVRDSEMFKALRAREVKGHCATCGYKEMCGGCRSRAYAISGDYLAEDPVCSLGDKWRR